MERLELISSQIHDRGSWAHCELRAAILHRFRSWTGPAIRQTMPLRYSSGRRGAPRHDPGIGRPLRRMERKRTKRVDSCAGTAGLKKTTTHGARQRFGGALAEEDSLRRIRKPPAAGPRANGEASLVVRLPAG